MAMEWMRRGNKEENDPDNKQGEFKPEELKKELLESQTKSFDELKASFTESLKPMSEFTAYIKEQREADARRVAAADRARKTEETEVDNDLWITDPAEAARRTNLPVLQQAQAAAALTVKREVLGDKDYYHGEFKEAVDRMIEQQPLHLRSNTSVLLNCYKVVLADNMEQIQEGKLKKQTFGSNFTANGTGAPSGSNKDAEDKLSEEESFFAKKFGMSDKDWIASKRELEYV